MATKVTTEEAYDARLNQLYWNSDRTIDDIVDDLSVGRTTLYAAVRPIATGTTCATCGDTVAFTNRTNRASGTGTCMACGMETVIPADEIREQRPRRADRGSESGAWTRWRSELDGVPTERAALIGGAAALGVMIGSVAAKALRA